MTTINVLNPEFEARGPSEVFMAARSIPDKPVVSLSVMTPMVLSNLV